MEEFKIVLDTEGVLVDAEAFMDKYAVKYFKEQYIKKYYKETGVKLSIKDVKDEDVIKDPKAYGVKEMFACSEEEEKRFWKKHLIQYFLLFPPRKDVVEYINKVRSEGKKVYNLTSKRGTSGKENFKDKLTKFIITFLYKLGLKIHGVKFDEINVLFSKNDTVDSYDVEKLNFIKENNINLVVEDKKTNVVEFSKHTKTLCMNTRNNENLETSATKVNFGNEIYVETKKEEDKLKNLKSIYTSYVKLPKEVKKRFTIQEKIQNYKNYREFILGLPFDKKGMKKGETYFKAIANLILNPTFGAKYHPVIVDKELLPETDKKGYIIVFNHLCDKDLKLISWGLKNIPWHPIAKIELLDEKYDRKVDRKASKYFKAIDSVFVDRKDPVSRANSTIESAKRLLNGGILLISPESTYNLEYPEKNLRNFKGNSAVYFSQAFDTDILVLTITKDYDKENGEHPLIRISKPFNVSKEEDLDEANIRLWNYMNVLIEENKRFYCFTTDNLPINKRLEEKDNIARIRSK